MRPARIIHRFVPGAVAAVLAATTLGTGTVVPNAVSAALPPGMHWIGVRSSPAGGTELFDRRTESRFTPRGVTLQKEEPQASGPYPILDMLVAPGHYDDAWTRARLAELAKLGYTTIRAWLDACPFDCLTNPDGSAKPEWLDNVASLLDAARDRGLTVVLVSNELPTTGYADQLPYGGTFDGGFNATILSREGINLTVSYWRTVIAGLQARGAPLEVVLAYELLNETFLENNLNPLALTSGLVTTANGFTYDMASQASRDAMVDEGLVYWAAQAASVIRALDPTALVTTGFFAPRPGDRLVRSAPFFANADVDFHDIHYYPGMGSYLADDLASLGLAGYAAKPVVLGEFGGFRLAYPDARAAANDLVALQVLSCSFGLDGWLAWAMGLIQPDIFPVEEDGGVIAKALSPAKRPDPCSSPPAHPNLALGRPVTATGQLVGHEAGRAVDGLAETDWNAGGSPPHSITVDLGAASTIREIRLLTAQYPAGPTTHVIRVRQPGGSFTTVHTLTGPTTGDEWLRWFPAKPLKGVRWVRIITTSSPSWVGWREVQAY